MKIFCIPQKKNGNFRGFCLLILLVGLRGQILSPSYDHSDHTVFFKLQKAGRRQPIPAVMTSSAKDTNGLFGRILPSRLKNVYDRGPGVFHQLADRESVVFHGKLIYFFHVLGRG